jgi:hypothetical protein
MRGVIRYHRAGRSTQSPSRSGEHGRAPLVTFASSSKSQAMNSLRPASRIGKRSADLKRTGRRRSGGDLVDPYPRLRLPRVIVFYKTGGSMSSRGLSRPRWSPFHLFATAAEEHFQRGAQPCPSTLTLSGWTSIVRFRSRRPSEIVPSKRLPSRISPKSKGALPPQASPHLVARRSDLIADDGICDIEASLVLVAVLEYKRERVAPSETDRRGIKACHLDVD